MPFKCEEETETQGCDPAQYSIVPLRVEDSGAAIMSLNLCALHL